MLTEEYSITEISDKIIAALPYGPNFRFVDEIHFIDQERVEGSYTFRKDHSFYEDHFVGFPLTPGVILTECMAQIGMVSLGIYLRNFDMGSDGLKFVFTSSNVDFKAPVHPGEKVTVKSEKSVFRLGKLRCSVQLFKEDQTLAAKGVLDGFIFSGDK
ncbi:MAG: hydroxymyristoyl-ACP dehydratase [Flavobacteriales bacterium]|nr:hydroxymyristoyl-ACP dehydratase [Flavobacteriales bacterium]